MPIGSHFRKWATQVARQAGEELDDAVATRLLSIAEHYAELAEREELATHSTGQVGSEAGSGANIRSRMHFTHSADQSVQIPLEQASICSPEKPKTIPGRLDAGNL
jgi:hypothetical protein